jgi:hypothetical protein
MSPLLLVLARSSADEIFAVFLLGCILLLSLRMSLLLVAAPSRSETTFHYSTVEPPKEFLRAVGGNCAAATSGRFTIAESYAGRENSARITCPSLAFEVGNLVVIDAHVDTMSQRSL